MTNLLLLVPVWMQLVHLLLADAVWITLVLLSATAVAVGEEEGLGARVRGLDQPLGELRRPEAGYTLDPGP